MSVHFAVLLFSSKGRGAYTLVKTRMIELMRIQATVKRRAGTWARSSGQVDVNLVSLLSLLQLASIRASPPAQTLVSHARHVGEGHVHPRPSKLNCSSETMQRRKLHTVVFDCHVPHAARDYAPTSLTHSHAPFRFSFHKLTFPSPADTAKTFPVTLHETLQTTSGNLPS